MCGIKEVVAYLALARFGNSCIGSPRVGICGAAKLQLLALLIGIIDGNGIKFSVFGGNHTLNSISVPRCGNQNFNLFTVVKFKQEIYALVGIFGCAVIFNSVALFALGEEVTVGLVAVAVQEGDVRHAGCFIHIALNAHDRNTVCNFDLLVGSVAQSDGGDRLVLDSIIAVFDFFNSNTGLARLALGNVKAVGRSDIILIRDDQIKAAIGQILALNGNDLQSILLKEAASATGQEHGRKQQNGNADAAQLFFHDGSFSFCFGNQIGNFWGFSVEIALVDKMEAEGLNSRNRDNGLEHNSTQSGGKSRTTRSSRRARKIEIALEKVDLDLTAHIVGMLVVVEGDLG